MTNLGFWIVIALLVGTNIVTLIQLQKKTGGKKSNAALPTVEEYRAAFPGSVDHQHEIRCRHCGSTSIHVEWVAFNQGLNTHSCRHCGQSLYRS